MKQIFLLLLCFLFGCSSSKKIHEPVLLDEPLELGSADSVGVDLQLLNRISERLAEEKDHKVHSMLVARNGVLVFEEYFNGHSRDNPHDLRSATKSITSLLAGIAIDQGILGSVEDPMMDYLKYSYPEVTDKGSIKLHHLLTMQSGLDCHDSDRKTKGQEDRMYKSRDWVDYFLSLSTTHQPGDSTRYCTGGVVALGEVIAQAAEKDFAAFADEMLFAPLGIRNYRWSRFDGGKKVDSGGHLYLTPQGMVKIGMLVSQNGAWEGTQLVSSSWLKTSTEPHTSINNNPYGYLWWQYIIPFEVKPVEVLSARGNGGQVIFVVPEYDLVSVFTAGYYNSDETQVVYDIFFRGVLSTLPELQPSGS